MEERRRELANIREMQSVSRGKEEMKKKLSELSSYKRTVPENELETLRRSGSVSGIREKMEKNLHFRSE